ncbi:hypothetical protein Cgig2_021371 [Carnegiea gigantea]|uniref:NAD-dependent protein deacetylase SRT1 n=1 Tax=Carnegiea gigantea TaxID=171969 RepID=A0A9Q1KD03_9CARY|nr:hypothetical protein Cgig2_021371 [Carnegiea gigantea]
MSLGYAQKLSNKQDVGAVGMPEFFDPPYILQHKVTYSFLLSSVTELQFYAFGLPPLWRSLGGATCYNCTEGKRELAGSIGVSDLCISLKPLEINPENIKGWLLVALQSKHLVAFTGAGISTSCGIPDFRGPKGIWTLQRQGKGIPDASLPFDRAMPSLTHMALVELEKAGILKFIISQNVDGLHIRSGIPREKLAELHGNSFREVCPSCGVEYVRDFEVETIGLKKTPRRCSDEKCKSRLRDSVLDWEDELPSKEMNLAEKQCEMADTVLCLGTSLQITPACDLPLKALRSGGKVVIVNLQGLEELRWNESYYVILLVMFDALCRLWVVFTSLCGCFLYHNVCFSLERLFLLNNLQQTPKDKQASLVIHGLVDEVMSGVMNYLSLRIPPFVRVDLFQIVFTRCNRLSDKRFMKWRLRVTSIHGQNAPLPFIKSVEVSFPGRPELKVATLNKQPFLLKRETIAKRSLCIMLKMNLSQGCGCAYTTIDFPVDFEAPITDINHGKDAVIQKLRETAIRDNYCGQLSLVEIRSLSQPKGEIAAFAVTTNICAYSSVPAYFQAKSHQDSRRHSRAMDYGYYAVFLAAIEVNDDGNMPNPAEC